jgi:hypothetical protein
MRECDLPASLAGNSSRLRLCGLDRRASARHGLAVSGERGLEAMSRGEFQTGCRAGFRSICGRIAGVALVLALSVVSVSQPRAATFLEKNFWLEGPDYDRDLPACDFHAALDRIIGDFRTKEFRFWNSELRIVGFENIHEIDTMPWAAQAIPRRFCGGMAVINDGVTRPIYYSIGEDTGIMGMDWGVNFCVAGLDRNWAYNGACRSAKP